MLKPFSIIDHFRSISHSLYSSSSPPSSPFSPSSSHSSPPSPSSLLFPSLFSFLLFSSLSASFFEIAFKSI